MKLFGLSVGQPWVLWGLLLAPLLLLFTLRSKARLTWPLAIATTLTRMLVVVLVVLAVADARVPWRSRRLAVAVAIDRSHSVDPAERAAVAARFARMRAAHPDVTWVEVPADREDDHTNLEAQLAQALGALPADRVRRVVLATDGRENQGDVLAAADRARRDGARVYTLPMGDAPAVDQLAVAGLEVPRLVRASRPTTVGVRLFSSAPREVELRLTRDGLPVTRSTVSVPAGPSIHDLSLEFPDEGVHQLQVTAVTDGDSEQVNNEWRSLVRVVSPPRVLMGHELAQGEPALAAVLRDARLRVDTTRVQGIPDTVDALEPYQLVVLDEMVLSSLSESQQRAVRAFVEERGGGLITTTGSNPVRREPEALREIEPVRPPRAIPEPRPLELILVIDRSGSMQGASMVNARNGAIAAVHGLRADARVGAVAFSGAADMVMPPVPMNQSSEVVRFISGIHAGGGTDVAAALNAAAGIISRDPRYLHHVILLSDGDSAPQPALEAAQGVVAAGGTITAITIGPRSDLMAQISRIGRGRYHVTNNPSSLPALLVHEAQYHLPPPSRNVRFRPGVVRALSFLDGVNFASEPPLDGFVLSDLRPGADLVLTTPDGGPLLAHWYRGLGQVSSWTSATTGMWANEFRASPGFRRLFSQMAFEMMRQMSEEGLELHVDPDPQHPAIRRVTAVGATTAMTPLPVVTLSRSSGESRSLSMEPRAPGVWQAWVPLGMGFVVDARMPNAPEPTVAAATDAAFSPELASFGVDAPMLASIAHAGGGAVLERPERELFEGVEPLRAPREVRLPLLVAALVLYLLGVLMLRMPGRPERPVQARAVTRRGTSRGAPTRGPSQPPGAPDDVEKAA